MAGHDAAEIRRAKAGLAILEGASTRQALLRAGYAPSTASRPAEHGLGADRCVAAARKQYPLEEPGKLVSLSRQLLARRLELALGVQERSAKGKLKRLEAVAVGEAVKSAALIEQWYGGHDGDTAADARRFVDRLTWIECLGAELRRRSVVSSDGDAAPQPVVVEAPAEALPATDSEKAP